MYNYIGIDVSKKELFTFDGKNMLKLKNESGLPQLEKFLTEKKVTLKNLVMIYESTGVYSSYIKKYCAEKQIKTVVINPKKSANFSKVCGNRSKTDQIDAKMIYNYKNIIKVGDSKIPVIDEEAEIIGAYLSSYEYIMKIKRSTANHLEALKRKLHVPESLITLLEEQLQELEIQQNKVISEAINYIKNHDELKLDFENLTSIKSVGEKSAVCLLYIFRKYPDTNRNQITALVGIDPVKKESGTSIRGKSKISKNGLAIVRKILYFPTMNAIQNNPWIRTYYNRLIDRHKMPKTAIIASMKKLLLIAHAIYKNKTKWEILNTDA